MPNFIELFAGCGGLSLGLRSLGFEELMANELSSMPAETFALNLLETDLRSELFQNQTVRERRVLWIDPSSDEIEKRLNDNPYERPRTSMNELRGVDCFKGKLIVGDIRRLNEFVEELGRPMLEESVDVISGGPPCQSFSMAGRRERENQRNQLPWEFARFVDFHRPKLVLLENVEGILRPFNEDGTTYFAWKEVCKAFAEIGYVTCPLLVNAKFAGVAQNRPRFLMFAVRGDLIGYLEDETLPWFEMGESLLGFYRNKDISELPKMQYWDLTGRDIDFATASVFRPLVAFSSFRTVEDAIGDLEEDVHKDQSEYVRNLNSVFGDSVNQSNLLKANTKHPRSKPKVQARFRLYQIMATAPREIQREIKEILKGAKLEISDDSFDYLIGTRLLDFGVGIPKDSQSMLGYLQLLATKKFSQRALIRDLPAPAALSIPDDVAHYSEPRTLSVREMARIQSFPDRFEFRGIATTGGNRRRYQVPQYTQIGNAVPPILGRAIGKVLMNLLQQVSKAN